LTGESIRRVLLLSYEYPPVGGGAGVAMRGLAVELARRSVVVDVVSSGWGPAARPARRPTAEVGNPGIAVYRVRSWRRGLHDAGLRGAASYLLSAWTRVRQLLRAHEYDVVHAFFSLPTGLLLPLVVPRGIPTVVSLRGSDVPGYDPTNRWLERLHPPLLPLTRYIWRRASRMVALSASLAELARRVEPGLQYAVIPNGVDIGRFKPHQKRDRPANGHLQCLCVARLTPRKGHLVLVEAFARLPSQYRLAIVGAGELESELLALVVARGLGDRVTLYGALDHEQVARLYQEADMFTLLPEAESFGNAFAEALAAGLPVVATRAGAIPDLIEDGVNGLLVAPRNAEAAADAIRVLGEDGARRREMAYRNRRKAELELSWSGVADRYLDVYRAAQATVIHSTSGREAPR
jgi:glycosyltransferase involved in cell wall biosynthesis